MRRDPQAVSLLRALMRLSGKRRVWVRTDRVLRACCAGAAPQYWALLAQRSWADAPELAEYRRLCGLIRDAPTLIEGRGNFGTADSPPAEPVFNRCRVGRETAAWLMASKHGNVNAARST
jgi:hypothetical protein